MAREARLVGINDVFVRASFNSVVTEDVEIAELESGWQRVEGAALPGVRRVIAGDERSGDRLAVKALLVLHMVRSYALAEVGLRIQAEYGANAPQQVAASRTVRRAFNRTYGRPPRVGEIEAVAASMWTDWVDSNELQVDRMERFYTQLLEHTEPMHVQVLRTNTRYPGFATGDAPAVHFDTVGFRLGLRSGLGYLECDHVYMPLDPTTAVMLTTEDEGDKAVSPLIVHRMNNIIWRAAARRIVISPDEHPSDVWIFGEDWLCKGADGLVRRRS